MGGIVLNHLRGEGCDLLQSLLVISYQFHVNEPLIELDGRIQGVDFALLKLVNDVFPGAVRDVQDIADEFRRGSVVIRGLGTDERLERALCLHRSRA